MDTVTILRRLWRFRLLVVAAGLLAMFVALFVSYELPSMESRKYEVGVATGRILVDTPASQVVEVAPKGSDSLGVRATLLANLMVDGVVKEAVAKRAGLAEAEIAGIADSAEGAPPAAGESDPRGYSLATEVLSTAQGDSLPIIEVATQGPDARAAEKLANAAIEGLQDYLASKAVADRIPDGQRLRVSGLGVPQAREEVRGPRLVLSVAAMIFVFALGCAAILVISSLIRAFRYGPAPPRERLVFDPHDEFWTVEADHRHDDEWEDLAAPLPHPPVTRRATLNGRRHANGTTAKHTAAPATPKPAKPPASTWWGGGPPEA
jgi:hypothetical protein